MPNLRIAIATYSKLPDLYDDDRSALPALAAQGIEAHPVVWDSGADWSQYDGVLIRSTWDYWLKYEAYLSWISEIDRRGIRMLNPPAVLRENTRKTYLKRMEARGIPLLPTRWIEPGKPESLHAVFQETGWKEAVLKPSVSGGAYRTHRITRSEAHLFESNLKEILADCEAMLQPLAPTILTEGEISFLFHGGEFSHAAIKRGQDGEFRIQRTYGGTVTPYEANPDEVSQARAALEAYAPLGSLLYARVDMVRDPSDPARLLLMELEAAEPNLFFLHDGARPGATERFAIAVKKVFS